MSGLKDAWSGPFLKYQLFQIGFLLLIFLMVYDMIIGGLSMGLYWLGFQYYLEHSGNQKKDRYAGSRHIESKILRDKDFREDKVFSFLHYKEIDRTDPVPNLKNLPEFKEAQYYEMKKSQDLEHNYAIPILEDEKKEPKKEKKKKNGNDE